MSNIRVTVEWETPVVFAGEEVRCIITFKNSSPPTDRSRSLSPYAMGRLESGRDRWKQDLPHRPPLPKRTQSLRKAQDKGIASHIRGHRPTLSLNPQSSSSRGLSRGALATESTTGSGGRPRNHGRSLSIVSLASNAANNESRVSTTTGAPTRRYHNRAASLQILPGKVGVPSDSTSRPLPSSQEASDLPFRQSPSTNAASDAKQRNSNGDPNATQLANGRTRTDSRASQGVPQLVSDSSDYSTRERSSTNNSIRNSPLMPFSPPVRDDNNGSKFTTANKIISPASTDATPRSSVELYSQSNLSAETLVSEYLTAVKPESKTKSSSQRGTHLAPVVGQPSKSETLMMGYVQLSGSFTLDSSLINMSPFEFLKMKGVIGGQGGGGVVGVGKSRRESGLLGSFGWGGIGQSLGELIGSQEMSSIKEMKGIASTKAIPIISTPHSILFVNLSLQPGESKSFSYMHRLPENIPPTYKGRAIKIEYQLVIGTQRPQQNLQTQSIRHADFAFKVLSGVNARGELPVYDLKKPHILLRDLAVSQVVDSEGTVKQRLNSVTVKRKPEPDTSFVLYVDKLLNETQSSIDGGLLSPTDTRMLASSEFSMQYSAKDFIEFAILRGNASTPSGASTNRFDIHRGGQRVATILLARSAYRLGEKLMAGLDFQDALLPCYAVHAFLETVEEVDESIALRSSSSITRATRRVQASCFENAICAQRLSLGFMIPTNAAPEFRTSNIQMKWSLRIEFTTSRASAGSNTNADLLEEVDEDDRGRVLAAAQELPCETFDVLVPIRVFGGLGEPRHDLVTSSAV